MDADEYEVTTEERENCRKWYEENILSSENPAYTFSVGGKNFRRNIDDWDFAVSEESDEIDGLFLILNTVGR